MAQAFEGLSSEPVAAGLMVPAAITPAPRSKFGDTSPEDRRRPTTRDAAKLEGFSPIRGGGSKVSACPLAETGGVLTQRFNPGWKVRGAYRLRTGLKSNHSGQLTGFALGTRFARPCAPGAYRVPAQRRA